jgi:hypothetical protein
MLTAKAQTEVAKILAALKQHRSSSLSDLAKNGAKTEITTHFSEL